MEPDIIQKPQKINYFSDALIIQSVDFPIYFIECISERHFIIAGGGGSSKTGVHNQINIVELIPTGESCAAKLVLKFQTPKNIPDAIMTGSLMRDLPIIRSRFVTGGSNLTVYNISFDPSTKDFKITDYEICKDKQVKAELKSVRYIPNKILTGGIDGKLTIWNFENNDKKVECITKAHTKEIDEIDVDLTSQQIVTLSREEGRCAIWNLSTLKLIQEFKKDFINSPQNATSVSKYNFRCCRFAYDTLTTSSQQSDKSSNSNESFLMVLCNLVPKGSSKIYKFSTSDYKKFISTSIDAEGVLAMNVSSDGKFLAIGTNSGSISVFDVFNLKRIYQLKDAHHNAVTKLEFLPHKPESLNLTNSKTCALLSVSIDRRVILHRPRTSSLLLDFVKVIFLAFVMYLSFIFIHTYIE